MVTASDAERSEGNEGRMVMVTMQGIHGPRGPGTRLVKPNAHHQEDMATTESLHRGQERERGSEFSHLHGPRNGPTEQMAMGVT